jgi:hypothetical protein
MMDDGNILSLIKLHDPPCVSYRYRLSIPPTLVGVVVGNRHNNSINIRFHCLIMVDLDHPSRSDRYRCSRLQWMVVDVPDSTRDINDGREVLYETMIDLQDIQ